MKAVLLVLLLAMSSAALAQDRFGAGDVARKDARRAQNATLVQVVAILPSEVQTPAGSEDKAVGAVLGGAAGVLAAQKQSGIVQFAAGIAGAAIGTKIAARAAGAQTSAVDVVVRKDSGETVVVTQQDDDGLRVGGRALLIEERPEWSWEKSQSARVRALPAQRDGR